MPCASRPFSLCESRDHHIIRASTLRDGLRAEIESLQIDRSSSYTHFGNPLSWVSQRIDSCLLHHDTRFVRQRIRTREAFLGQDSRGRDLEYPPRDVLISIASLIDIADLSRHGAPERDPGKWVQYEAVRDRYAVL